MVHKTKLLYRGEVVDTIAGFPTLYHYQPPSSFDARELRKPLIVCVTGGLHLGRVFYGGHDGSRSDDFLAYWLSQLGFGVLSLSYPLETEPEIMPATAPGFGVRDWGRQAAETASMIVKKNSLPTKSVVLVSWSMGGRMVVPFTIAATELGLDVQQFIGFAASPGFTSVGPSPPGLVCSPAGYFGVPAQLDGFYQQLEDTARANGGQAIIPRDVYEREYTGKTPINLTGLRLDRDAEGASVQGVTHEEDSQVLDAANLPLISALSPNSILDAGHALTDRASWGFLLTGKLETMIGQQGLAKLKGTSRWQRVVEFVHAAPRRLCVSVPGNHFFFVGERSAQEAADRLSDLIDDGVEFRNELADLLS